jgi:hypothetical protein
MDPEYFITAQGPFVYYTRYTVINDSTPLFADGVWCVDTGLGPPAGKNDGREVNREFTLADNHGPALSPGGAGDDSGPNAPTRFALHQNVPNPFNPATTIRYDVPAGGGRVTLRVYDVKGRLVRTLVDGHDNEGVKQVSWYGRNDRGSQVATGVYFYRMTAPGFETTKKMVLQK